MAQSIVWNYQIVDEDTGAIIKEGKAQTEEKDVVKIGFMILVGEHETSPERAYQVVLWEA